MAREIKFRVWDPEKKVFIKDYIGINNYGVVVNDRNDIEDLGLLDGAIIQQFTGLKDKNNKEIYEGDILEINYSAGHERDASYDIHGNFQVIFKNGEWKAIGDNIWGDKKEEYSVWGKTNDYVKKRNVIVEVIGNILQNTDLLN